MTSRLSTALARHVRISNKLPPNLAREALTRPWVVMKMFSGDNHLSRVPDHYKKFYWEWKMGPRSPVHYIPEPGNFKKLPTGEVLPIENLPIRTLEPRELHNGIWGGEAIIKGFQKRKALNQRVPHYWVPTIKKAVLYSEILDRYMSVEVTERTLNLVDEHYGFDTYILKTSAADLMSELALKLRREMYLTLARGKLYPDNPAKKEEILEKYKEYMIPEEEAEWFGLTSKEAATKQKILEHDHEPQPLKYAFRKEFIEYLENNIEELKEETEVAKSAPSSSWLTSVNPFAKK